MAALGRTVGYLNATQEAQLARAVVLAYDLEVPLLGCRTNARLAEMSDEPRRPRRGRSGRPLSSMSAPGRRQNQSRLA